MSKKVMLINATDSEDIRVATLVDGVLSDFEIEIVQNEIIKGNIYKAKIVRVDQSLQAAFIHYGAQKNGFLPIGELPRDLVSSDGRRGRIQDLLQRDQEIMVQAVREEMGTKGAMMSAQISLPGRYLVLTPGNPLNGISRKIESREEREHFKRLIDELDIPKNMGVIVRTASLGVTKEDFQRDLEYLLDTYREVQGRYRSRKGPGLVWQEDDVVTRTLRDCFSADMEEVHIDDLEVYHTAQHFFRRTMPQHLQVLKHYVGKKPLFSKFQTDEQIDRIYARKVALPSGGALVIDQTEALVAIDVNSGKTSGEGVEDMAFKTNMEAAEEAARQLRLRDLAGLVVIDFIDMKREGHIKSVQDRLVDCLKEDKARMEVGKINRFGVLVMTRQRIRPSIQHATHEACPTCQGMGKVKTLEAMVLSVVRRIKAIMSKGTVSEIRVKLAPVIAMSVLNGKRKDLADLEEQYEGRILIQSDHEVSYGEMAAEIERRDEEPAEKPQPRSQERSREDEETVVLGGDSPISFEKAMAEDAKRVPATPPVEIRYDRRDAQRAALEERERLRAMFESAKPEDGPAPEASETSEVEETATAKAGRSRRNRGRGKGKGDKPAADVGTEVAAPVPAPAVKPQVEVPMPPQPKAEAPAPTTPVVVAKPVLVVAPVPGVVEPEAPRPVLNVADLLTPSLRPKLQAKVEAVPTPVAKPVKAPRSKAKPAVVVDSVPAPRKPREAKAEVKVEPKAEVKVEPKAEVKRESKPEVKVEAKAEPKAPAKTAPKAKKAAKEAEVAEAKPAKPTKAPARGKTKS